MAKHGHGSLAALLQVRREAVETLGVGGLGLKERSLLADAVQVARVSLALDHRRNQLPCTGTSVRAQAHTRDVIGAPALVDQQQFDHRGSGTLRTSLCVAKKSTRD